MSAEGKCIYPKEYLHTLNTKPVRFYLPLPISVTVSIFTLSALIFLTLTPNIPILFTAIHNYHH